MTALSENNRTKTMSKEIVEVKQYTGMNCDDVEIFYTVRDGDKYILCNYGSVFFTDKEHCEKMIRDNENLDIPHSKSTELDVFEINGVIGVYNWNMKCLSTHNDLWDIVNSYDDDRFSNFTLPKVNEEDYYDDYSDDFQDYAPSYYDPRYDGPFHYIPPGEH